MFGTLRTPRNLVFGAGQRAALPTYVNMLGKRALVVTDERLAADHSFAAMVDGIRTLGVQVQVFPGTIAELPASCIAEAVAAGCSFGADVVMGVGGGS